MASRFQSRLIGTIVLVAIGVIILPDVLDGKKSHYKEDIASIPIKPAVDADSYHIVDPDKVNASLPAAPVKPAADTHTVAASDHGAATGNASKVAHRTTQVKVTQRPQTVKLTPENVPEKNAYQSSAWIIQLMALKNNENAVKLVKDLQNRGFQAHTKRENDFTRIIIGPDVSKEKLEQQLVKLEEITGAKGRLIEFKPLNP